VNAPEKVADAARSDAALAPVRLYRAAPGDSALAARLRKEVEGEVLFDAASRGRYSTDASIYQIEPVGVVVPRTAEAARIAVQIAAESGVPVLPRGAGSSQCGQTVGAALVIDNSKYLNQAIEIDAEARTALVQPGLVLDHLNARLKQHKLWFPVDVSTSAQATLGGMAGNNSCGSRSIAYGNMVHNVLAIDALTAQGERWRFGRMDDRSGPPGYLALLDKLAALYAREKDEIEARFPKVQRRVAGYNLDHLGPPHANAAHLLVGSEGTLAYFERLLLRLTPLPVHKTLGVVHFPTFYQAMDLTQHIVKLGPSAVELVDRTMIGLARDIAAFRKTVDAVIKGEPDAVLLVEFSGDEQVPLVAKVKQLVELMADLGLPGSVVEVLDAKLQKDFWEVREAGLNIMMSMKGDGKPVSFIEDCAVPLEHLADYTDRLTQVFRARHQGHLVRACLGRLPACAPVLNMKLDGGARQACAPSPRRPSPWCANTRAAIRASTATASCAPNSTSRCSARDRARFEEVKDCFDPRGPDESRARSSRAPKMDDRTLFRYKPGYQTRGLPVAALDWSDTIPAPHGGQGYGQGGRDVQQQRHLPQVRRRHHVPLVTASRGRAAPDARPRQHAAPGAVGPAGRGPGLACRRKSARPWNCASPARAASANARPAWTWRR
jgi:FAD/FMN-containing dehydrogenase